MHPRTGILCERPRDEAARIAIRDLSPTRQHWHLRGHWYEVTLAAIPLSTTSPLRDAVTRTDPRCRLSFRLQDSAETDAMRCIWRSGHYAASLRQLSKRELADSL